MKRNWLMILGVIGFCGLAVITYSQVQMMRLAEEQAERQRQQETQRLDQQRQLEAKKEVERRMAAISAESEAKREATAFDAQHKLNMLDLERRRQEVEAISNSSRR